MEDKKIDLNEEVLDEDYDPEFDAIWGDINRDKIFSAGELEKKLQATLDLMRREDAKGKNNN